MKTLATMTEPELRDFCTLEAKCVKMAAETAGVEPPLFVLLLFNDPKVAQYVANCERATIVQALREAADRLEKDEDVRR